MEEYISRDKVLEVLEKADSLWAFDSDQDYLETRGNIKRIPAADVQSVKHGRWESSQRTIETGTVYCSNCAIEYYISDLQTVGDCNGIVHYCPNCGANMRGDAE